MKKHLQVHSILTRPVVLLAGVLGIAGCAGATDNGVEGTEAAGEPTGASAEAFHAGGPTLPWRGAAQKTVMQSSRFSEIDVVYGVDIGISTLCHFINPKAQVCGKAVRGLQVFSYNQETNTTYATIIGQTTAGSWTRELCPNGGVVSGYKIGVGTVTGQTRIESFGINCVTTTTGVGTNMPVLGNQNILFPEILDCKPRTTSPVSWIGNIRMNFAGDGMGADCIKP